MVFCLIYICHTAGTDLADDLVSILDKHAFF